MRYRLQSTSRLRIVVCSEQLLQALKVIRQDPIPSGLTGQSQTGCTDVPSAAIWFRRFFEGTGVLVLDRINGVAYVALSERANQQLAEQWVSDMGYRRARTTETVIFLIYFKVT